MGKCVMLNEDSGNIIWAITLGCPTFSNSCILQLDDKNNFVVCATVNGRLLSINTTNGKIVSFNIFTSDQQSIKMLDI